MCHTMRKFQGKENAAVNRVKVTARILVLVFLWSTLSNSAATAEPAPAKIKASISSVPLDRFESDIRAFEEKDKESPPPSGGTVFVGSSTFTKWESLEKTFSDLKAINRGFGGSTLPDVNHYVARIVTKYNPKKEVLYAGTNDIAELKHTGAQVLEDTEKFVDLVHKDCPAAEVYIVSPSIAPCRLKWGTEYDTADKLIASYVKTAPKTYFVDVVPVMRDSKGKLRTDFFGPDNLHMNERGYAAWTPIIRKALVH